MKKIFTFIFTFFTFILFGQEVKIEKNDIIKVDNVDFLKYEKINHITHSFKNLNNDEIIFLKFSDNETRDYREDDFYTLNFINEKIKLETTDMSRIQSFSMKRSCEKLVFWLLKDKVINTDGTINKEKLDVFYQKYHEDIQNRTSR